MKLLSLVITLAFFISFSNEALGQFTVSGKVLDENNNPLQGVTVAVKEKGKATSTNSSGNYSLNVESLNATLIFTSIGYSTKEVQVNNRATIDIQMQLAKDNKMDEIVVVGYTTKKLSEISSSISVVTGRELNDVTSNDVTSLLQGKAAGVVVSNASGDPSAQPAIVIRGSGSISAGPSPLTVVDGIIGGYANPTDVESVTILKDAAATGLYGSRASNGVIIINTKSGKSGRTKINLTSTMGFSNVTMGNFKVMNSQQLYDYQKTFYPSNVFATERPDSILNVNTNWHDLAYRTGLATNYALSISGGSEKTQIYFSGSYYNEEGTVRHTGNESYNLRTNITHKISEKLKLSFRLNARSQKIENDASGNYGAIFGTLNNMPFDNPYNPDGSIKIGTEKGWTGRENDNFLHGWQYNFDYTYWKNIIGDVVLSYNIGRGLTLSTYNRISYLNGKHEIYYDVRSKAGKGVGELRNNFNSTSSLITSNRLQYDKKYGVHTISVIAVAEAEKNLHDENTMLGNGLPAGLHVMNAASTIKPIPIPKPGVIADNSGIKTENAFSKGLVQAQYDYASKYFFVGSLINESSSRFGSNKRSANFYTLAGSWLLSRENFMNNIKGLNQLKFRVSYGSTGNANIGDYQSLGLYSFASQYNNNSASIPFQIANPDLTWERAQTLNLGLDIGILKRISLTLDWYDKNTNDLLLNVPLPYTSGYASIISNIGSIRNKGFELTINSKNIDGRDFKWETSFNIAFNKNRVTQLNQGKDITVSDVNGNATQRISVGRDLYSWYMKRWEGVDPANGDPLWEKITVDANGNKTSTTTNDYNAATLQFVGTASPDFTGGLNNVFSYKRISLSAFFNFVSGNLVYNSQFGGSDGAYQTYNERVLLGDESRWMKPGDITTFPKSVFGGNHLSNNPSSRFLENGSYIRLRNVRLSYDLPESLLTRIKIDNIRLYISGDNLWTGTKHFVGQDPSASLSIGSGSSVGVVSNYAISKKILFGLNISF